MQYEPLINQTSEQMRDVLAAKMLGGWLLHRLLADVPLDSVRAFLLIVVAS